MPAYPDSVDDAYAYEYWHMHVQLITALAMGCSTGRQDSIGVFVRLDKPYANAKIITANPRGKYVGDKR